TSPALGLRSRKIVACRRDLVFTSTEQIAPCRPTTPVDMVSSDRDVDAQSVHALVLTRGRVERRCANLGGGGGTYGAWRGQEYSLVLDQSMNVINMCVAALKNWSAWQSRDLVP